MCNLLIELTKPYWALASQPNMATCNLIGCFCAWPMVWVHGAEGLGRIGVWGLNQGYFDPQIWTNSDVKIISKMFYNTMKSSSPLEQSNLPNVISESELYGARWCQYL